MYRQFLSKGRRVWRAVCVTGGVAVMAGATAQVTQPTPIFGFVRTVLQGTSSGSGVNYVGPSFVERAVQEVTLQAGAPLSYTVQAVGAAWSANAFDSHPTANSHYIEVQTSPNLWALGMMSDIVSHTSDTLTLADDLSGVLRGGETLVIRPHKTLEGIFGVANEAGLASGDVGTADLISTLAEGSAASFSTYYYRFGSPLGGAGWRSSSNPFADQGRAPVKTGHGLIIKRTQAEPMELVLRGFVKMGLWRRHLPRGYALVDPLAPLTDQRFSTPINGLPFTLGGTSGSGVIASGLGATLSQGTPQSADLVSLAGKMASFYIASPTGLSSGGWRITSNPLADQQNTVIPPASAMLIQNRGEAKRWSRPQPFLTTAP